MGQEFFINSQELESKVRQLLPSQGGAGAGFDLTASTQIIPIIDLTESAEGSNIRQDLQTSFSLSKITSFAISNANTDIITNTGYFRVYGVANITNSSSANSEVNFSVTDGTTTKKIVQLFLQSNSTSLFGSQLFDFVVKVSAGESVKAQGTTSDSYVAGNTRQIASIDGVLIDP